MKTFNFLQESQWWSREQLEAYQMKQLRSLLEHAYAHVPYYTTVFNERGLKPKDIKELSDLRKLPYLSKDLFRAHSDRMLADNARRRELQICHTSGTTGKPLQWYRHPVEYQKELAFIYHLWSRVGVRPGHKMAQLRGTLIAGGKACQYEAKHNILRFSPRFENEDVVRYYLKSIQMFGAKYIHGYPSSIAFFCSLIKRNKIPVPFSLKAVLFASESIYQWERDIVEEVFDCRVFSHYGMAEYSVLAGESEASAQYCCVPQYGITELHPETGEIVGTGFINYTTPLIRYKTTDVAYPVEGSKRVDPARQYYPAFSAIEGRMEDYIMSANGTPISPAVITHPFKDFKAIKETQIVQTRLEYVILRVVPWKDAERSLVDREASELREELARIIGPGIKISSEIIDTIEETKSGKFRWIVSEVSKESLVHGLRASRDR